MGQSRNVANGSLQFRFLIRVNGLLINTIRQRVGVLSTRMISVTFFRYLRNLIRVRVRRDVAHRSRLRFLMNINDQLQVKSVLHTSRRQGSSYKWRRRWFSRSLRVFLHMQARVCSWVSCTNGRSGIYCECLPWWVWGSLLFGGSPLFSLLYVQVGQVYQRS